MKGKRERERGGGFRLKPHIEAVSSECGEMGDV